MLMQMMDMDVFTLVMVNRPISSYLFWSFPLKRVHGLYVIMYVDLQNTYRDIQLMVGCSNVRFFYPCNKKLEYNTKSCSLLVIGN